MSAFVVNNHHINAMLQVARPMFHQSQLTYTWEDQRHIIFGHSEKVGQKLVDENVRSTNYCYQEDRLPYQFHHDPFIPEYTPVEIIKACNCYSYQACETPDWEKTEAHAIMTALRERAIRQLPGYEEATWEIVG